MARSGTPYLASSCATAPGRSAPGSSATPTCSPARFERGDIVRVRGRVERFREELQLEIDAIARAQPGDGRPRRVPAGGLPRPRRARRLPRAPRSRGARPGPYPRAARRAARRRAAPRRAARRALHTRPATTPTSAACSSTRSRSRRSRSRRARCIRGSTRPAADGGARARPRSRSREFTYGAEIGAERRGPAARPRRARRCGWSIERASRPALDDERRLALAHCVLAHHGPDRRARAAGSSRPEALALYRA